MKEQPKTELSINNLACESVQKVCFFDKAFDDSGPTPLLHPEAPTRKRLVMGLLHTINLEKILFAILDAIMFIIILFLFFLLFSASVVPNRF